MSRPTVSAARSLADTQIGERLTDYVNFDVEVRQRASGGFSLIFMGHDLLHPNAAHPEGRWFALKTLRPEILASERNRDLFLREALTWIGLWPHRNLLTAQGVTEINGQLVLVLDYAADGSLRDLLRDVAVQRPNGIPHLSLGTALTCAQQIAAGLVALHTPDPAWLRPEPIVHRDLKPENVLIEEHGFARITDFGLAKVAQQAAEADPLPPAAAAATRTMGAALDEETVSAPSTTTATDAEEQRPLRDPTRSMRLRTQHGIALGTPAYIAPEQWQDAATVGPAADCYAFGLMLAELFTGQHPLLPLDAPASSAQWRAAHLSGAPCPLVALVPELAHLPLAVEELYQALLAKDPAARPSAAAALAALQDAATALGEDPYSPPDAYLRTAEHEKMKWHNWATAYERFGLYSEALLRIERAYRLAPHDPHVLAERGTILAALGRLEEALGCYDAALADSHSDDHQHRKMVLYDRGNLLHKANRYGEAEMAYAAALAELPEAADAWFNRALNQRVWAEAEEAQGQRELAQGQRELARQHAALALQYARQALALNPANANYHRRIALAQQLLAALGG